MKLRHLISGSIGGIVIAVSALVGVISERTVSDALRAQVTGEFERDIDTIRSQIRKYLDTGSDDAFVLARAPAVQHLIEDYSVDPRAINPETLANEADLQRLMESIAKRHPSYLRLRYVDNDGLERVKVESLDGATEAVDHAGLEDNSSEDYFQRGLGLSAGEIYISPASLDRSRGEITTPYRPTVRMVTPVFTETGKRVGMIVINFNATRMFSEVTTRLGQVYITNEDGFYIKHADAQKEFSFELGRSYRVQDDFAAVATSIADNSLKGQNDTPGSIAKAGKLQAFGRVGYNPFDPNAAWTVIVDVPEKEAFAAVYRLRWTIFLIGAIVTAAAAGLAWWLAGSIARPLVRLSLAAKDIASGRLDTEIEVKGADEVNEMSAAFATMVANLRDRIKRMEQLVAAITEAVSNLANASSEILATTTQQSHSAEEQVAAVTETSSALTEIVQTVNQSADRARALADGAQRAAEVADSGRKAVEGSIKAMGAVRERTEEIAASILTLSERARSIGEIIAAVSDIAEQTNLLALNAGIEASRAGEQGSGFAHVAREIKALAEQSKKSTTQVRQILGEIQKATSDAVVATEQGTESVQHTMETIDTAGDTIRSLSETVSEAATNSTQIAASAGQQANGIKQIEQALKDIDGATTQTLAGTRQSERAAKQLDELGQRLKNMLAA